MRHPYIFVARAARTGGWLAILSLFLAACTGSGGGDGTEGDRTEVVVYAPARVIPYVVDVDAPMAAIPTGLDVEHIEAAGNLAADWQIRHMDEFAASELVNFQGLRRYSLGGWLIGTMAIGMTRWGLETGSGRYLDFVRRQAREFAWGVEARVFDADDYAIGQTYLELFDLDGRAEALGPLRARLDYLYDNWPAVNRDFGEECETMNVGCRERWTWIDALFMGATVWIHMASSTGDERYLEFGDHEFWASFDTFWDPAEHLLYRDLRFVPMRDADGQKVFWSRGNGWVFAALARILPKLPAEHANRPKYIERFRAMASRLAELQRPDGSWSSSLTNPSLSPTPENSGSAFFAYGIAWGINERLLERELFLPVLERAWASLVSNLYADGRLAYVQPSGAGPQIVHKESTDVYGVGAFLLAASEAYRFARSAEEAH